MWSNVFSKARPILLILLVVVAVFLTGRVLVGAPASFLQQINFSYVQHTTPAPARVYRLLNGKTASLSWIVGRDCQQGMRAYLQTAGTDPDAALVGPGWVDPTNGHLINGQSNNCVPGSLSMDNVVQLVHSKGGMAYLTITMETDGTAQAWTSQQAAAYVDQATTNQDYIDSIMHEVLRANYDGVIMDLEGIDRTYPSIQQLFATYNQHLWTALRPLHKFYGIALLHKLSDHDDYYDLNGFENWSLLAHTADFIVIMAVDQSYFTPGPTVSIPWLNQLLAYALQNMPDMLPHIIWELPLYGDTWHWENGGWVYDGGVSYQAEQTIINQLTPVQIDQANSSLHDLYAPHVVYTDTSGVKHSLWPLTGKNLYYIIVGFWQALEQVPQFADGRLQIAVWYRTTLEPQDFWSLLNTLYH